eukprot:766842-Hanusia_phi.AAC.12
MQEREGGREGHEAQDKNITGVCVDGERWTGAPEGSSRSFQVDDVCEADVKTHLAVRCPWALLCELCQQARDRASRLHDLIRFSSRYAPVIGARTSVGSKLPEQPFLRLRGGGLPYRYQVQSPDCPLCHGLTLVAQDNWNDLVVRMPIDEPIKSKDIVYKLTPASPESTAERWARWEIEMDNKLGRHVAVQLKKAKGEKWDFLLKKEDIPPDMTVMLLLSEINHIDGETAGRIVIGLFGKVLCTTWTSRREVTGFKQTCPRTAYNFRALCTGEVKGIGFSSRLSHLFQGPSRPREAQANSFSQRNADLQGNEVPSHHPELHGREEAKVTPMLMQALRSKEETSPRVMEQGESLSTEEGVPFISRLRFSPFSVSPPTCLPLFFPSLLLHSPPSSFDRT